VSCTNYRLLHIWLLAEVTLGSNPRFCVGGKQEYVKTQLKRLQQKLNVAAESVRARADEQSARVQTQAVSELLSMAQSVRPLRAAARDRFPVLDRLTISVEKLALFCNPALEGYVLKHCI
jgi:hypothetical protein